MVILHCSIIGWSLSMEREKGLMNDNLPYVLNPLILLKLMKIIHKNMGIGNNNINSKLQ